MLEITEIFSSLQGEGPFMGRPAAFVRLSGCIEPCCPWCDTAYARERGRSMDLPVILEKVAALGKDLVVITGGEPFMQWKTGLAELETRLLESGYRVQYETSGKAGIPDSVKGHVVCSPKFLEQRWCFDTQYVSRVDDFKFVVVDDCEHVSNFVRTHNIPSQKVWIMPLGATRNEQLARLADTWNFCETHNFNFTPRLHTLAFNNKRGV